VLFAYRTIINNNPLSNLLSSKSPYTNTNNSTEKKAPTTPPPNNLNTFQHIP
jgi:hypothetical protein